MERRLARRARRRSRRYALSKAQPESRFGPWSARAPSAVARQRHQQQWRRRAAATAMAAAVTLMAAGGGGPVMAACSSLFSLHDRVARPSGQGCRRWRGVTLTRTAAGAHREDCGDGRHEHRKCAQQRSHPVMGQRRGPNPVCAQMCSCHARIIRAPGGVWDNFSFRCGVRALRCMRLVEPDGGASGRPETDHCRPAPTPISS
jgi:hypothetical protein